MRTVADTFHDEADQIAPVSFTSFLTQQPTAVFFIGFIAATIVYGWTLDRGVNLAVPLIAQFISQFVISLPSILLPCHPLLTRGVVCAVGLTITTQFNSVSTLLVDLFPTQSASATAANNVYRCLLGAAGTAIIDPVISKLGAGELSHSGPCSLAVSDSLYWESIGLAFTMLSLINVCFVPLILIEWKYGMQFRLERAHRKQARQEVKAESKREKKGHDS